MKTVKLSVLATALVLILSNFINPPVNQYLPGEKIAVNFSHKMDFDGLAKLKTELSLKDVQISYQQLSFDDGGKLKEIEFKIVSEGKYCGSGASKILSDESKFGFEIDRSPNAQPYFRVGNL